MHYGFFKLASRPFVIFREIGNLGAKKLNIAHAVIFDNLKSYIVRCAAPLTTADRVPKAMPQLQCTRFTYLRVDMYQNLAHHYLSRSTLGHGLSNIINYHSITK
jgi:hypothetical protein